jgi:hypothetical protein
MTYMKYSDASLYHTALESRFDDLIRIYATLIRQTAAAYCVDSGETDKRGKPIGVWIPKSMSRYSDGQLTLSERYAIEKGLL